MILLSAETNLKPDNLSPKERRKLRNVRREELKEKKGSWKEEVESKLDVKKKPPKGWEEILDIDRLATKGYQWWMLSVPKNNEQKAADQLDIIFPERFPRVKYEVRSSTLTSYIITLTSRKTHVSFYVSNCLIFLAFYLSGFISIYTSKEKIEGWKILRCPATALSRLSSSAMCPQ